MNNIKFHGSSEQGRRAANEDNFITFVTHEGILITAIADGMGGHRGGRIASTLTVKLIEDIFKKTVFTNLTPEEIQKRIIISIRMVQKKLIKAADKDHTLLDMGTTLNLNVFIKDKMYTLNIGDSRTSQFTKKEIVRISEDHNLATLAMKDKNLERFKGYTNYLTSSLGPQKETKVDMFVTRLNRKGFIIMTTDGVHNFINAPEMIKILKNKSSDLKEKADEMIALAYDKESNDNMTVVLVRYGY